MFLSGLELRKLKQGNVDKKRKECYLYFQEINKEPVVYHWKYKMDEINEDEAGIVDEEKTICD